MLARDILRRARTLASESTHMKTEQNGSACRNLRLAMCICECEDPFRQRES